MTSKVTAPPLPGQKEEETEKNVLLPASGEVVTTKHHKYEVRAFRDGLHDSNHLFLGCQTSWKRWIWCCVLGQT